MRYRISYIYFTGAVCGLFHGKCIIYTVQDRYVTELSHLYTVAADGRMVKAAVTKGSVVLRS